MNIKNNNALATITTPAFLAEAITSIQSAKKYNKNVDYYIFYLDIKKPSLKINNINILTINDIYEQYHIIANKYGKLSDETRWNLKPIVLLYLLSLYKKVIYIDPDIYFVNNWNFLYDKINSLLLTSHMHFHNKKSPSSIHDEIHEYGLMNAGFVGASRESFEVLRFWSCLCYDRCKKSKTLGLYDDQKYLDTIYLLREEVFHGVDILRHFGCNIAHWNIGESNLDVKINNLKNNKVLINNDLLIFLHFSFLLNDDQKNNKYTYSNLFNYYINKYKKYTNKISYYISKYNESNNSNSISKL